MAFYPPVTISNIIQKIDYQALLLPAIQREFVWKHNEIEILFDSLMRDYPIGSLLLWKVNGENKKNHRFYSILKKFREKYKTHCEEVNTLTMPDFEAVLDGQQRLTALYLGLKGSYAYKIPRLHWVDNEYALPTRKLFLKISEYAPQDDTATNVSDDDGRLYDFKFLAKKDIESLEAEEWFEVGDILGLQGTYKLNSYIKEKGWEDNEFINETLSKLHDIIHVTPIVNYYLESDPDYNKALNIFIRINSGGEKLDYSDLIMSTLIASWSDAREEINNAIDEIWDSYGFEINKDLILRAYLLVFSKDIKFRVTNFSSENAKEFQEHWEGIRESVVTSFELIRDFGYSEQSLTSKNAVLPIVYYLFKSGKAKNYTRKEAAYKDDWVIIKKWFHAVLLHRIFGGQADAILKVIREPIKESIEENKLLFPAESIAKRLSKTRKSITVDDEFIENLLYTRYEDRYAFPILALLYPHLDYKNGDFHKDHIHPKSAFTKSKLKKAGIENTTNDPDWYFTEKNYYNGIVNLQMLDGNQNISKGKKSLSDWVTSSSIDLEKHLIPDNLGLEEFEKFVDTRWEILKEKLKDALTF
ncbi:MAG: DUF262 domain-containing protein [Candidatus Electrothrix sp. AW1]|nr:DUF262 domain-containing protein [Candidatus Electrothrix sp. AX1]MCI5182168.1 DUF262 domain-containing protein [Candidatus Electrothrix gigas]